LAASLDGWMKLENLGQRLPYLRQPLQRKPKTLDPPPLHVQKANLKQRFTKLMIPYAISLNCWRLREV